jgi:hypothetical protein
MNRATCAGSSIWTKCRAPLTRNSSDSGKSSWKRRATPVFKYGSASPKISGILADVDSVLIPLHESLFADHHVLHTATPWLRTAHLSTRRDFDGLVDRPTRSVGISGVPTSTAPAQHQHRPPYSLLRTSIGLTRSARRRGTKVAAAAAAIRTETAPASTTGSSGLVS